MFSKLGKNKNHFPFGAISSGMQTMWNHSVEELGLSQPVNSLPCLGNYLV